MPTTAGPETEQQPARFNSGQQRQLRALLGLPFPLAELLECIEQHRRHERERANIAAEHAEKAQRHAPALAHALTDIARLRRSMATLVDIAPEAVALGYLESDLALAEFNGALLTFRQHAYSWQIGAASGGHRRPGRPHPQRRELAVAVARVLRAHQIELSTTREGSFTRGGGKFNNVLKVVYDAAGIDEPIDLFDDLKYAMTATSSETPPSRKP